MPLPAGRRPVPSPSGGGPGRGRPSQRYPMFIAALCAPRMGHDANIWGNRVSPCPSLRGGARFPPPAGEGQGGGGPPKDTPCSLRRCAPRAWGMMRTYGATGFPHAPPCGEEPGSLPQRGRAREGAALPKIPHVHCGVVRPAHGAWCEHMGQPGCPTPLPAGRRPVPSPSGGGPGRGRPSQRYPMFIAALCAPRMGHGANIWGNRVAPRPCLPGRLSPPPAVG